ncbi:hypothetical protein B4589_001965 [Halolamina sp. CBA1230]|uniref:DUF6517 family protein n=1 Tax=Halolamina sp. CBA1230 TaxID=1853690 RepID=UPI0009A1ABAD|nr:DUF6517 family protein [Halolamina sp. CBA1230]QKY19201.1 hypothetical protein B4589_001965 [Halolamina sp. CBA1230]
MLRRLVKLGVVGVLLFAAVGGGWVVVGGPLQGTAAAPLTVDASTAADHGFAEPSVDTVQFQERLAVAGVGKEVDFAAYTMHTTNQETGAAVTTVSLPGWTLAGVSLNPVTYAPLKQAVNHVLPYLPVETPEVTWAGETTVELGGENVTAGEYAVAGEAPRLLVARETVGGDTVFAVGVYSGESPESRASVETLFTELDHE